jgi:MSHA biogenesis protein MshE
VKVTGKKIDVRLSTMPVQFGESAVMRILNQDNGVLGLDRIGMPEPILQRFRQLIHAPNGVVLVTGPTGSGKTTTLYGGLQELNTPEVKILTAEDPVEYRLKGINQVQVNPKIDLTFARVLRTFLRQDPDIILIGEMRDRETVEIGLRAAITGHFVMSSLHTNDAIATAMRLVDMGAAPYLIAAALRGIVAQRLVRKVCDGCASSHELDERERAIGQEVLGDALLDIEFKKGKGCNVCNQSGYQGRAAVYEFLEIDADLVKLLQSGDMMKFAAEARRHAGFKSLKNSAIELAKNGVTSFDEVIKTTFGIED